MLSSVVGVDNRTLLPFVTKKADAPSVALIHTTS